MVTLSRQCCRVPNPAKDSFSLHFAHQKIYIILQGAQRRESFLYKSDSEYDVASPRSMSRASSIASEFGYVVINCLANSVISCWEADCDWLWGWSWLADAAGTRRTSLWRRSPRSWPAWGLSAPTTSPSPTYQPSRFTQLVLNSLTHSYYLHYQHTS